MAGPAQQIEDDSPRGIVKRLLWKSGKLCALAWRASCAAYLASCGLMRKRHGPENSGSPFRRLGFMKASVVILEKNNSSPEVLKNLGKHRAVRAY